MTLNTNIKNKNNMKLNNTQIKALAQEVLNKIPDNKPKFTKEQLIKYTKVCNKLKDAYEKHLKLKEELDVLESQTRNYFNEQELFDNRHKYFSTLSDVEDLEKYLFNESKKPTLDEIVHKITLETIFETKESLTDFIDNLVKHYSK